MLLRPFVLEGVIIAVLEGVIIAETNNNFFFFFGIAWSPSTN
jgi:hypothetical protein